MPYLLALATASNIGSVATIVGNPQNMLIASLSRISYVEFAQALGPVAIVGLALDAGILCWVFRRDLHGVATAAAATPTRPIHRAMTAKTLIAAGGTLAGFIAGWDPALVAVSAASALLVSRRVNPSKLYRAVDWDLLVLFIGLFVVIGGVERAGLDRWFFERLTAVWHHDARRVVRCRRATVECGQQRAGGHAVHQTRSDAARAAPVVARARHVHDPRGQLDHPRVSVANLIVVEGARRSGVRITFGQHLAVGVPVTCVTLIVGVLWLHTLAR